MTLALHVQKEYETSNITQAQAATPEGSAYYTSMGIHPMALWVGAMVVRVVARYDDVPTC